MSLAGYSERTSVRKRASSILEVALRNDLSEDTLRREIRAGRGPKVTQISERRQVILDVHEDEWLASRVLPAPPERQVRSRLRAK
jgi:hypothetical protein